MARRTGDLAKYLPIFRCRRCKGQFHVENMIAAKKVRVYGLPPDAKAVGRYCRECAFVLNSEVQPTLPLVNGE